MLQSLYNCIRKLLTSFALLFNLSPREIMVDIVMFQLSVFIDFARSIIPSAISSGGNDEFRLFVPTCKITCSGSNSRTVGLI